MRLALSNGHNRVDVFHAFTRGPKKIQKKSFRSIVFIVCILEYQMMEKFQKSSYPERFTMLPGLNLSSLKGYPQQLIQDRQRIST
jgi:hypothetical protein